MLVLLTLLSFCHILIQTLDSLYGKLSHVIWHQVLTTQLSLFKWSKIKLGFAYIAQLCAEMIKKNMPNVVVIPPADDCGTFFPVAAVSCVIVLIDWLHWSVQLNNLFTTNFMKNWDLCEPSQADTQSHAAAHKRSPPGCIFTITQPVYDYLFHCGKPDWTPTNR